MMPTAETETGKTMASHPPERPMEEPRTRAAQVASANEGAEEVGAHACEVAHVVAHVVRDGGGVAWVVLRDAVHHLSDKVGADVGGLGVDAAADAAEHSHGNVNGSG